MTTATTHARAGHVRCPFCASTSTETIKIDGQPAGGTCFTCRRPFDLSPIAPEAAARLGATAARAGRPCDPATDPELSARTIAGDLVPELAWRGGWQAAMLERHSTEYDDARRG